MTPHHAQASLDRSPEEKLPTSDLLIWIVERFAQERMSVGDLIDGLGGRAFSIIFLLLTLPIAVPGPPGLPTVFGIPLLIVTTQLWLGRATPWLPEFIRRRRFSRSALLAVLKRVKPTLARLERVCRPRITELTGPRGERWIGAFFCLCSLVLINPIPIPFSHLPLAIGLAVLSLGYVERDGIVVVAGLIGSVAGIIINFSLMGGVFVLGAKLLHLV